MERGRNTVLTATALDPLIINLGAMLVTSHLDEENVVGTYKGGYWFAPFIASVDCGTGQGLTVFTDDARDGCRRGYRHRR
jgi:hypothetical protein